MASPIWECLESGEEGGVWKAVLEERRGGDEGEDQGKKMVMKVGWVGVKVRNRGVSEMQRKEVNICKGGVEEWQTALNCTH